MTPSKRSKIVSKLIRWREMEYMPKGHLNSTKRTFCYEKPQTEVYCPEKELLQEDP